MTFGCFRRGAPSLMFDGILNATLPRFQPLGLYKQILNFPYFLILLIYNKHKIIRYNFRLTSCFYFLENEHTNWEDKAKNVWLIVGQLPIKAGWWGASLALQILAEAINKTIFPSNTAVAFIMKWFCLIICIFPQNRFSFVYLQYQAF